MLIAASMVLTALAGARPVTPGYVITDGGVIAAVGQGSPPGTPDVALPDGVLAPGLVDLQVNGYFGVEFQVADAAALALAASRLPRTGTTAFQPTVISAPVGELATALRAAAGFVPLLNQDRGARVLGVHVEGPFIAASRRGAHNPAHLATPDPASVAELLAAAPGVLRLVTIAPELPGALAAVERFAAAGVVVSVGHTDATADQVARAADAGARMVTHLYNAQRGLGHREPGVVGQALADQRLTCGLICDLHHVAPAPCRIAFAAAPGRVALVTDAAAAAGMPPGQYRLGGEPITLPAGDGKPPVRGDGVLAGSALRMDRAVANAVSCGVSLPDAVAAAARVPADLIGRRDLGRLAAGAAADLIWLSPGLVTRATWVSGRLVYADGSAATVAAVGNVPVTGPTYRAELPGHPDQRGYCSR